MTNRARPPSSRGGGRGFENARGADPCGARSARGAAGRSSSSRARRRARSRGESRRGNRASNPERDAPPVGGNVGGYNYFWLDPGNNTFELDGKWRTSIITDPPNGRRPPMTKLGDQLRLARLDLWGRTEENLQDRSDAWWLEKEAGPFDGPEMRPMGERCVLGFGSPAGPPILPVVYNNLKRIVQTEHYVMILAEMVHDARIIPIVDQPASGKEASVPRWLGNSVGHWDGDTLVVATTNFFPEKSPLSVPGTKQNFVTSGDLRVTERFSRIDAETLRYQFTVEDPTIWTAPWSGEFPWPASDQEQ